uniref:VCBS domain-containing protein n=1 Tax=Rubripirellula obstinata TaxID=406547 RepID=UPI000833F95E
MSHRNTRRFGTGTQANLSRADKLRAYAGRQAKFDQARRDSWAQKQAARIERYKNAFRGAWLTKIGLGLVAILDLLRNPPFIVKFVKRPVAPYMMGLPFGISLSRRDRTSTGQSSPRPSTQSRISAETLEQRQLLAADILGVDGNTDSPGFVEMSGMTADTATTSDTTPTITGTTTTNDPAELHFQLNGQAVSGDVTVTEDTDPNTPNTWTFTPDTAIVNTNTLQVVESATVPTTFTADDAVTISFESGASVVEGDSIQAAINAAPAGSTVRLGAGTFAEKLTLSKSITLIGAGQGQTIIDATGETRGIEITATSDVTIQDLTIQDANFFGIHTNGPSGVSNVTIQDVTITGIKRTLSGGQAFGGTAIDLNGVTGTNLVKDVTVIGNEGYGIALSSAQNVTIRNAVTALGTDPVVRNEFGGIGIFPSAGASTAPTGIVIDDVNPGLDLVTIQPGSTTITASTSTGSDVKLPLTFVDRVASTRLATDPADNLEGVSYTTAGNGAPLAGFLVSTSAFDDITLENTATDTFTVLDGMSIQDAIDAAENGDTVNLTAGPFAENILADKPVTIAGQSEAGTILDASGGAYGIHVTSDDVTIESLTIDAAQVFGIHTAGSGTANLTITNVTASNSGIYEFGGDFFGNGFDLNNVAGAVLTNVTATGNGGIDGTMANNSTNMTDRDYGHGISITGGANVTIDGASLDGNAFAGLGIYSSPTGGAVSGLTLDGTINVSGVVAGGTAGGNNGIYIADMPGFAPGPLNVDAAASVNFGSNISVPYAALNLSGDTADLDQFARDLGLNAKVVGGSNVAGLEMSLAYAADVSATVAGLRALVSAGLAPADAFVVDLSSGTIQTGVEPTTATPAELEAVFDQVVLNTPPEQVPQIEVELPAATGGNNPVQDFITQIGQTSAAGDSRPVEVKLSLPAGETFSGITIDAPQDVVLIISGTNNIITGASPALAVLDGEVIVRDGVTINQTASDETIRVEDGGKLTLQNVTVNESSTASAAAILVLDGGELDMSSDDNTINIVGTGTLIDWQDDANLEIVGNTLTEDDAAFANNFAIEQAISHAIDNSGNGLVTWVDGELFVAAGGSIQNAIDAASEGDTVNLAAGTYTGNLNINKGLSLVGPNAGTTGSLTRTGEAIIQGVAPIAPDTIKQAVIVSADNVTIDGVKVDATNIGFDSTAIRASDVQMLNIEDTVVINGTALSPTADSMRRGINLTNVNNATVTRNAIDLGLIDPNISIFSSPPFESGTSGTGPAAFYGVQVAAILAGTSGTVNVSNNQISGAGIGVRVRADNSISGLTVDGNTITDVVHGLTLPGNSFEEYLAGDINGVVSSVAVTNNTFGTAAPGKGIDAALVGFDGRNNVGTGGDAAPTINGLILTGNTFNQEGTGNADGEGPDNSAVFFVDLFASPNVVPSSQLIGTNTITTGAADDIIVGGTGPDTIDTGAGDDFIQGKAGDDDLTGGAGTDTAVFSGNIADAEFETTTNAGFITAISEVTTTADGTDTLSGIERLQFDDGTLNTIELTHPVQVFSSTDDLEATFPTLSAAIAAASSGDTIRVAADLNVTEDILVTDGAGITLELRGTVAGEINIEDAGTTITAVDTLVLGDASSSDGFVTAGTLNVGNQNVTLLDDGSASLGSLTTLTGGTLTAANGITLSTGDTLSGFGTVNGGVSAGLGTVHANTAGQALTIGTTAGSGGFSSSGAVTVDANATLVIVDSNAILLGATTTVDGTLTAQESSSSFDVDSSGTLTSNGTVNGDVDVDATATLNGDGDVNGDITVLSGGTLAGNLSVVGDVTIDDGGTHAPGNSPGITNSGDYTLNGTLVIEIELDATGGIVAGDDHDQTNVTGTVTLGTTSVLNIVAANVGGNGLPANEDSFVIINNDMADGVSGTFGSVTHNMPTGGFAIDYAADTSSNDVVITYDNVAPDAPIVQSVSTDSGINGTDGITSDNTLVYNGTAEADSTVEVFVDGSSAGTTTADSNGEWLFDDMGTTVADGTYTITATATDAAGNVSLVSTAFTLTVDTQTPEITAAVDTGLVTELGDGDPNELIGNSTATGTIDYADPQTTDTGHTVTTTPLGSGYLGFVSSAINSNGNGTGTVTWTYNVANSAIDFLAAGETLTQNYRLRITDSTARFVDQVVVISITGTNDAPVVSATTSVALNEQTDTSVISNTQTVTFADVDLADVGHTASVTQVQLDGVVPPGLTTGAVETAVGTPVYVPLLSLGTVTKTAGSSTGSIANVTFSAGSTVFDYLAAGEQVTLTYTIAVNDGEATDSIGTQTLVVTITGTNDAPVITDGDTSALEEDTNANGSGDLEDGGSLAFTDVDLTDTHTVSEVTTSTVWSNTGGMLPTGLAAALDTAFGATLGTDSTNTGAGSIDWTFSLANDEVDFLAAGETLTVTYTVTVTDVTTGATDDETVIVTITGTNDAPEITVTDPVDFTEGDSFDPIGSATPTTTVDTQTVDLLGLSDPAVPTSALITEITDVDLTDVQSISNIAASVVASSGGVNPVRFTPAEILAEFTIVDVDAVGGTPATYTISFDRNATLFDRLDDGESIQVAITYDVHSGGELLSESARDTQAESITITINGSNDAPHIIDATTLAGTITERADGAADENSAVLTATAAITFDDIEELDMHSVTVGSGTVGTRTYDGVTTTLPVAQFRGLFSGGQSGTNEVTWTFNVSDGDLDDLAAGEVLVQRYTITIDDGTDSISRDVEITITGTNDAPVIDATIAVDLDEQTDSSVISNTQAVTFTDVDLADVGHTAAVTQVELQGVVPPGITDGDVELAGGSAVYASLLSTGAVTKATGSDNGSVADVTFSADSTVFDYLAENEVLTLTYTIAVDDAESSDNIGMQTLVVTITGTNDEPVVDTIAQTNLDEQTDTDDITADIDVTFTDVDLTDVGHTASITGVTTGGTTTGLALDATALTGLMSVGTVTKASGTDNGEVTLTFTAGSTAFDYLAEGEVLTLTYTVEIDDEEGLGNSTGTQTFVVEITGTNDDPVVDMIAQTNLDEQTDTDDITADIAVTFTDVDLTDVGHTASITGVTTGGTTTGLDLDATALTGLISVGTVTKASGTDNGDVTLTFTAGSTAFDYLAEGEVLTLTYTVEIDDEEGLGNSTGTETFVVEITGTNDGPVANAIAAGTFPTVDEDETFGGTLTNAPGPTDIPISTFATDVDDML